MKPKPLCPWLTSIAILLVALVLLPGCRDRGGHSSSASTHGHDSGDDHDHDHDDDHGHDGEPANRSVQFTVWTDRFEVFADHAIPVAGQPAGFAVHVTDLKNFEPIPKGTARFQWRQGQESPFEVSQDAPARPGIFEVKLTFPKAGDWQGTLILSADGETHPIPLATVEVYADAHATLHAKVPETIDGIAFPKEHQWRVHLGTAPVSTRSLVEHLRLPAQVTALPGRLARVTTPIAGLLGPPQGATMPRVGDRVRAGQTLALLQPSFSELAARWVEADREVARTRLALEQADLSFQRIEKLARAEARSGRELQEADFALKTARANFDAALAVQATYRAPGAGPLQTNDHAPSTALDLKAPIEGVIAEQIGVALGEFIASDRPLFTVLDATRVMIEAPVPEAALARLPTALRARYERPGETGRFHALTGEGGGRLIALGLQVDPITRTVPILYEFPNPELRLRVGQSLTLEVETSRSESALSLPAEAIVEDGGRPVAYVQRAGETFERRDLVLGIRDGNWIQVLSGLREGERVVTQAAYAVRLASVSATIPAHSHAH